MELPDKYDIRTQGNPNFLVNVFLDGNPVSRCVAYDVESGVVTLHKTDDDGRIIHNNGIVEYIDIHGNVSVEYIGSRKW